MRDRPTVSLMIVDDNKAHRCALAKIFAKEGYRVAQAADGEEAITLLSRSPEGFDLIIADLRMPKKDGLQLLQELKQMSPQTMVIILTACGEPESFREAMKRGAFEYLHKPIRREEILRVVEKAVGWQIKRSKPEKQGGITMKRMMTVGAFLLVVMLIASEVLAAPHHAGGQMPMGGQAGQQPMMGGGMMCPMMGMMPMMQQMMGGMMDPSGMGMMGGGQMDPKAMGRMLQLRGEMLKAIGEVLLKYGKAMEEGR